MYLKQMFPVSLVRTVSAAEDDEHMQSSKELMGSVTQHFAQPVHPSKELGRQLLPAAGSPREAGKGTDTQHRHTDGVQTQAPCWLSN